MCNWSILLEVSERNDLATDTKNSIYRIRGASFGLNASKGSEGAKETPREGANEMTGK